jgi:hypothetical protein
LLFKTNISGEFPFIIELISAKLYSFQSEKLSTFIIFLEKSGLSFLKSSMKLKKSFLSSLKIQILNGLFQLFLFESSSDHFKLDTINIIITNKTNHNIQNNILFLFIIY